MFKIWYEARDERYTFEYVEHTDHTVSDIEGAIAYMYVSLLETKPNQSHTVEITRSEENDTNGRLAYWASLQYHQPKLFWFEPEILQMFGS